MKLTITLQFNSEDNSSAEMAITKEQAALPQEDFEKLVAPAIQLIHHNAQAYFSLLSEPRSEQSIFDPTLNVQ